MSEKTTCVFYETVTYFNTKPMVLYNHFGVEMPPSISIFKKKRLGRDKKVEVMFSNFVSKCIKLHGHISNGYTKTFYRHENFVRKCFTDAKSMLENVLPTRKPYRAHGIK